MIEVKINSEAELLALSREMLHILVNMRSAQIDFHAHYGTDRAKKRKEWEGKADKLISRLSVSKSFIESDIKIEIGKDESKT